MLFPRQSVLAPHFGFLAQRHSQRFETYTRTRTHTHTHIRSYVSVCLGAIQRRTLAVQQQGATESQGRLGLSPRPFSKGVYIEHAGIDCSGRIENRNFPTENPRPSFFFKGAGGSSKLSDRLAWDRVCVSRQDRTAILGGIVRPYQR